MGGTGSTQTLTPGAGQTAHWNTYAPSLCTGAASTEQATGTSVTMSWTAGTSAYWAIAAVPINPRPSAPALTASPSPPPPARTSQAQGAALPVSWTPNAAVATRPVQHLGGQPAAAAGTSGKIDAANGAAQLRRRVDLTCPSTTATPLRLLPRQLRRPLERLRARRGHGRRDRAAAFTAINVTAPSAHDQRRQGATLPVSWTPNVAVPPPASSASGWSAPATAAGTWARLCRRRHGATLHATAST